MSRKSRRPRLFDRLALRLSACRRVDGLWLGVFLEDEADRIFGRVEEALGLIKAYDRRRYDRLLRDLKRVWVLFLPEAAASYDHSLRACRLSTRLVLAEDSTPEIIAATIVHEATHARLERCGIEYRVPQRPRVESLCTRRERAFAAKLPNGQLVHERAERTLAWVSDPAYMEYWTDYAWETRDLEAKIQGLRELGTPEWFLKLLVILRNACLRARRFFSVKRTK